MSLHPLRWLAATALSLVLASPVLAAPRFRPLADDVFYMYMPIAWRDSDGDAHRFGDFGGMTAALPYLRSLGVTAVWMTPVFPSAAYHGYQHGDADSVDVDFGTRAQLLAFVQAAHAESIKVFLDFVVYGSSQATPEFQSAYADPSSPYDRWYAFTNAGNTQYLGCCPYTTWDGSTVGFVHWDLREPVVTQQVTQWALGWLDPDGDGDPSDGVDGFRLDHVSAYHPQESPWGYDLAWWQQWKAALQARAPAVITFAEQADWGSYGVELLGPFDAAFTKPFEFAARAALGSGIAADLAGSMATTLGILPPDRTFLATLGNHDVARLATALGDVPGRLRAAAAVLLLQPLPPVIYFGDELGMRGGKRTDFVGDAADIPFREPFKWNAVAGPPMSDYFRLNAAAYSARVARDGDGRSVEEQSGVSGSLLEHYRALTALRHAHPALRGGEYLPVPSTDPSVWAFVKTVPGETLLVAIRLGAATTSATLDLSGFRTRDGGSPVADLLSRQGLPPVTEANRAAYDLPMSAYGHRVLQVGLRPVDLREEYADAPYVVVQDAVAPIGDHVYELDQMFVRPGPAGLDLGIGGNLPAGWAGLALFVDAQPGGQSTLATASFPVPPYGPQALSGLTFDAGFTPERLLYLNEYQGVLYADLFTLATGGGGSKRYLGSRAVGSAGVAGGGDNPNGLRIGYSGGNRAGVSPTSAALAATATDGFRLHLPWPDLGLPAGGGPLSLLAMLMDNDGQVRSQMLPGIGSAASPGYPPFDLGAIAGQQYFVLPAAVGVGPEGAPMVAMTVGPNPVRGALRVEFALSRADDAMLEVVDVAGRRAVRRALTGLAVGTHRVVLDEVAELPAGLWFVRLRVGGSTHARRVMVVR